MLAITGKIATIKAQIVTDFSPGSIQITNSGAIATTGTVWKKTMYG